MEKTLFERRGEVERGVGVLTLNRPERLNAIDEAMLEEIDSRLKSLLMDDQIRVIVFTGAGSKSFCAGADVSGFSNMSPSRARAFMRYGQKVFQAIEDYPKPVICAINGYALGGGLELALASDLRVAALSAQFGQPEITLANIPGWGGTQRLPRIIGEARAKELILSGRILKAEEALAIALVNRVARDESVLEDAVKLAQELAKRSPVALGLAKSAIHASRFGSSYGYEVESANVAICFSTEEQHEAVRQFLKKGKKETKEGSSK